MKFWLAFGASVVNRSTSMSPFSVEIVALVIGLLQSVALRRDGHLVHLDRARGVVDAGGGRGDRVDRLHALRHVAEDRIRRRQAALGDVLEDDEELAAVRVRAGV